LTWLTLQRTHNPRSGQQGLFAFDDVFAKLTCVPEPPREKQDQPSLGASSV